MSTFPYEDESREPEGVPINDHDEVTPAENAPIDNDALITEYLELEKSMPPVNDAEERADWKWLHSMWGEEVLTRHLWKCVIVRNQQVLEAGLNPILLLVRWSKKLGVNPGQFALRYIDGPIECTLEEACAQHQYPL